jgi:hypothetical protein
MQRVGHSRGDFLGVRRRFLEREVAAFDVRTVDRRDGRRVSLVRRSDQHLHRGALIQEKRAAVAARCSPLGGGSGEPGFQQAEQAEVALIEPRRLDRRAFEAPRLDARA